jgi:hypothetical protein
MGRKCGMGGGQGGKQVGFQINLRVSYEKRGKNKGSCIYLYIVLEGQALRVMRSCNWATDITFR